MSRNHNRVHAPGAAADQGSGKIEKPRGGGGLEPLFQTPPPLEGSPKGRRAMEPLFVYPPLSRADGAMDVQPF